MEVKYLYVSQYDGELNVTTPRTFREGIMQLIVDMTLASEKELFDANTLASFAEDDEITYEATLSDGQLSVYKLLNREEANAFYQKGKHRYSGKVIKL